MRSIEHNFSCCTRSYGYRFAFCARSQHCPPGLISSTFTGAPQYVALTSATGRAVLAPTPTCTSSVGRNLSRFCEPRVIDGRLCLRLAVRWATAYRSQLVAGASWMQVQAGGSIALPVGFEVLPLSLAVRYRPCVQVSLCLCENRACAGSFLYGLFSLQISLLINCEQLVRVARIIVKLL